MSTSDPSPGQPKYYDPGEVEAYVNEATTTIKALQARLQEAARRADEAEHALGEYHPETASLGRALLLAGEVADKTIADADARAVEIVHAAEQRAAGIVEEAHAEAHRLVEGARTTATDVFQNGEARLLAAVSAFVEGSNVLRNELARIKEDATGWRGPIQPPQAPEPPALSSTLPPSSSVATPPPSPPLVGPPPMGPPPMGPPPMGPVDLPGGVRDWAARHEAGEPESPVKVTPFLPPQPPHAGPDDFRGGDRS